MSSITTQHEVYRDELDILIYALSEIAYLKADRLQSNWHDGKSAKMWERAGQYLQSASRNPAVRAVSINAERRTS